LNKNLHKYNILVAPLDWGLGHTTRCLLLINTLQSAGYTVFFAGNTVQQTIVKEQFKSNVNFLDLPGYSINYSRSKWSLPFKIVFQTPKIISKIYVEQVWLKKQIAQHNIHLVISDNRYGLFSRQIPSVFITHQLQILAPYKWMIFLLQKINYWFINKYNLVLIPDVEHSPNAAGCLSKPTKMPATKTIYLGLLNRFLQEKSLETDGSSSNHNICILISGPEPQRTILEQKMLAQLQNLENYNVTVLRGVPNAVETINYNKPNVKIHNHLPQQQFYAILTNSNIIVARSGYTTLMEVLPLHKKLILFPTPGQTEQEYLSSYLASNNLAIAASQHQFYLEKLLVQVADFNPQKHQFKLYNEDLFLTEIKKLLH
jgi:uncharacterized protein (TIGR00661 family)